ncbi:MAG: hypothetical protein AMXMBFR64_45480 [Myxococcales bacterium]
MRRAITREMYDRLVTAFRAEPGRFAAAAKATGCDPRTAKRGWEDGWESQHPWAVAIKSVVEQDALIARAKVRELAAQDATDSRAAEGALVRRARANVVHLLEESDALMQTYPELVRAAAQKVRELAAGDDIGADELLGLAERIVKLQGQLGSTMDQVMRLERKLLGAPEEVIGVMTEAEVLLELEAGRVALERMRQRRRPSDASARVIEIEGEIEP